MKNDSNQYGLWKDGVKLRWLKGEKEALNFLTVEQEKFSEFFKHELDDIIVFLTS
jgi:hypothetical protein